MDKKQWELDQIGKMMGEISNEPLCNILTYAAAYLKLGVGLRGGPRTIDKKNAETLERYSDIIASRNEEI